MMSAAVCIEHLVQERNGHDDIDRSMFLVAQYDPPFKPFDRCVAVPPSLSWRLCKLEVRAWQWEGHVLMIHE